MQLHFGQKRRFGLYGASGSSGGAYASLGVAVLHFTLLQRDQLKKGDVGISSCATVFTRDP